MVELVELSKFIRRERRERIREMAWERDHPRLMGRRRSRSRSRERNVSATLMIEDSRGGGRGRGDYDEERVIERDIIYDTPRRSTRTYYS